MAEIIAEFFLVIGVDVNPPANIAELIPYLFTVFIGVTLVSAVFSVFGKLAAVILDYAKWK